MNLNIKLSKAKLAEMSAEFLGTFFFMFVLFVSPLAIRSQEPLLIGLFYTILVFVFMGLSKAHFNPIFTFGDFMLSVYEGVRTRNFSKVREELFKMLGYLGVQILAAVIAFLLAYRLRNVLTDFQLAVAGYGGSEDAKAQLMEATVFGTKFLAQFTSITFVLEMFFSMALVLFYQFTSAVRRNMVPFVLGISLFVFMVLIKDLTGGSLNPVRSLVPAIMLGGEYLSSLWVYLVAPLVGAILGSLGFYLVDRLKHIVPEK